MITKGAKDTHEWLCTEREEMLLLLSVIMQKDNIFFIHILIKMFETEKNFLKVFIHESPIFTSIKLS